MPLGCSLARCSRGDRRRCRRDERGPGDKFAFEQRLTADMREWLAADIAVHSDESPLDEEIAALAPLTPGIAWTHVFEVRSMVRSDGAPDALPAVLKVVDTAQYPFYGRLETAPSAQTLDANSVWISSDALERLSINVGDTITLNRVPFVVRAVITAEPDRYAAMAAADLRVILTPEGFTALEWQDWRARTVCCFVFRPAQARMSCTSASRRYFPMPK